MRPSVVSFAFAIVALGLFSKASAQTMVPPGALSTSQVWTLAGSPYILTGDVQIPFNTLLVIQPGVVVRVNPGDAFFGGFDSFRTEIRVDGRLFAQGTPEQPIVFEAATMPSRTTWSGIRCEAVCQSALVEHVVLRHAQFGLYSAAFDPALSLNRSRFEECQIALTISNGAPVMDALEVTQCDVVGQLGSFTAPTFSNALFHNNGFGVQALNSLNLHNCTIDSCGYGVYVQGGLTWIRNCSVTNNADFGVFKDTAGVIGLDSNNVWNNGADYFAIAPDPGSISADPSYEDAVEFRLPPGSANIDAGADLPAVMSDRFGNARPYDGDGVGGAQWDIGAAEFVDPCVEPAFTLSPSNGTASLGSSAGFTVSASGSDPLEYQWRKDGVPLADDARITGSQTDTITIGSIEGADLGVYDCVVSNACGSTATNPVALCVSGGAACEGNANGDAIVDFDDLVAVLANWLSVCP